MVALEDGEEAKVTKQMSADGVLVGAVDILPSELPKDASEHFSRALFPLMESAAKVRTGLLREEFLIKASCAGRKLDDASC